MHHDPTLNFLLTKEGYLRQTDLIGEVAVSPEQAAANKAKGKGPKRTRAGKPGLVPFSPATLWRKVKAAEFPAPVKLSERVTAWRTAEVLAWLKSREA